MVKFVDAHKHNDKNHNHEIGSKKQSKNRTITPFNVVPSGILNGSIPEKKLWITNILYLISLLIVPFLLLIAFVIWQFYGPDGNVDKRFAVIFFIGLFTIGIGIWFKNFTNQFLTFDVRTQEVKQGVFRPDAFSYDKNATIAQVHPAFKPLEDTFSFGYINIGLPSVTLMTCAAMLTALMMLYKHTNHMNWLVPTSIVSILFIMVMRIKMNRIRFSHAVSGIVLGILHGASMYSIATLFDEDVHNLTPVNPPILFAVITVFTILLHVLMFGVMVSTGSDSGFDNGRKEYVQRMVDGNYMDIKYVDGMDRRNTDRHGFPRHMALQTDSNDNMNTMSGTNTTNKMISTQSNGIEVKNGINGAQVGSMAVGFTAVGGTGVGSTAVRDTRVGFTGVESAKNTNEHKGTEATVTHQPTTTTTATSSGTTKDQSEPILKIVQIDGKQYAQHPTKPHELYENVNGRFVRIKEKPKSQNINNRKTMDLMNDRL